MLEEIGLPYEPHTHRHRQERDLGRRNSCRCNPNGKIPAIIDPDGPGGKPLGLFESGAILLYLAEKTGKLLPADPASATRPCQWVFFQMAAVGPMFGQVGFFHKFAGREYEDKRPLRSLRRREQAPARRAGDPARRAATGSWATTTPSPTSPCWAGCATSSASTSAGELVDFASLKHVPAWLERGLARPAVQRGLEIPKRP